MTHTEAPFRVSCIDACTECMLACEVCAEACLTLGAFETCVRACRDCKEVCGLTAMFLARSSVLSQEVLGLCLTAAEQCAVECEATGLEHAALCSDLCQKCVSECRLAMLDYELELA